MLCETVSVSEVYVGALGNELSSCTSVEDMVTDMLSLVGLYKKRESRVESRASELHLPVNINKHVVGQVQIRLKVGEFWRSDDGEDSVLDDWIQGLCGNDRFTKPSPFYHVFCLHLDSLLAWQI